MPKVSCGHLTQVGVLWMYRTVLLKSVPLICSINAPSSHNARRMWQMLSMPRRKLQVNAWAWNRNEEVQGVWLSGTQKWRPCMNPEAARIRAVAPLIQYPFYVSHRSCMCSRQIPSRVDMCDDTYSSLNWVPVHELQMACAYGPQQHHLAMSCMNGGRLTWFDRHIASEMYLMCHYFQSLQCASVVTMDKRFVGLNQLRMILEYVNKMGKQSSNR